MKTGFKEARRGAILALEQGNYQHEARDSIDVKNKLATGDVTPDFVADIIKRSRGNEHTCSPHHSVKGIDVHVIFSKGWYVKFYFIHPDTFFISVHQ